MKFKCIICSKIFIEEFNDIFYDDIIEHFCDRHQDEIMNFFEEIE